MYICLVYAKFAAVNEGYCKLHPARPGSRSTSVQKPLKSTTGKINNI